MSSMNPAQSASPIEAGRILLFADAFVGNWMSHKFGHQFLPPFTTMGFLDGNRQLVGGVIFNQYHEGDIEISIYAPGRLRRGHIVAICRYVFETLKCNRISARTRASSLDVRRNLDRAGFVQEGTLRRYYEDGENAVLYGMTKEDCRWLPIP
jgi:RimJ/RimL family protein N-acetyltransferase